MIESEDETEREEVGEREASEVAEKLRKGRRAWTNLPTDCIA